MGIPCLVYLPIVSLQKSKSNMLSVQQIKTASALKPRPQPTVKNIQTVTALPQTTFTSLNYTAHYSTLYCNNMLHIALHGKVLYGLYTLHMQHSSIGTLSVILATCPVTQGRQEEPPVEVKLCHIILILIHTYYT